MLSGMKTIQPTGSLELDLSKATEVEERLATAVQKLQLQARQLQERKAAGEHTVPS